MSEEILKSGNAFDLGNISKLNKISGARKTAVLLMTLGTEVASKIIKNLSDSQIQKVGVEIANIHTINSSQRKEILKEFINMNKEKDFILEGGIEYTKSLLHGALDDKKADELLEGIKYDAYNKVFTAARNSDANKILSCIKEESSQTIAIILAHIQPEKAAQILCKLDKNLQSEVALKLGNICDISPLIIKAVDNALENKLKAFGNKEINNKNGVDSLSSILSNVDRKTEKNIINFLESKNSILANQIKDNMFIFDDIVKLDDIYIQRILKEINVKDIAKALKGCDESIAEKIYKNQSYRAVTVLKEEIELLGPIKISQAEEAQQKIVNIIKRLEVEGQINLSRGNKNEFVV